MSQREPGEARRAFYALAEKWESENERHSLPPPHELNLIRVAEINALIEKYWPGAKTTKGASRG